MKDVDACTDLWQLTCRRTATLCVAMPSVAVHEVITLGVHDKEGLRQAVKPSL